MQASVISRGEVQAAFLAGVTCLLVSLGIAIWLPIARAWYGLDSLSAFLSWTGPYSLFISIISLPTQKIIRHRGKFHLMVTALSTATLTTLFIWTVFAMWVGGSWLVIFRLPLWYLWTVGAFAGLLAAY